MAPADVDAPDALSVLVVEPALASLLKIASQLLGAGFKVTAAETFSQAKPLLTSSSPAVLMTAVRLGAYNGLHLVLRGKSQRPDMAALVMAPGLDPVLQRETEDMGATFLVTPISARDLIAAVLQTVFRPGAPIRPPFERRFGQRRTTERSLSHERRAGDRRRVLPWLVAEAPDPVSASG